MNLLLFSGIALAIALAPPRASAELPGEGEFALSFEMKGTNVGWDVGVVHALHERLDPATFRSLRFVGSSSGAIMSAFFACRGFDAPALAELETLTQNLNRDFLTESDATRFGMLLRGLPTEIPFRKVARSLDQITLDGTCMPKHPLVIAASNGSVLDSRGAHPFERAGQKRLRRSDNAVFDDAAGGRYLGKACTYFADRETASLLSALPAEQRLCEVREIREPADLRLAIEASIAEPTYFHHVPDPADPARWYNGGYVMPSPIQDLKRNLPGLKCFGTGRAPFSRLSARIIQTWFLVELNRNLFEHRWWLDSQIKVTASEWTRVNAEDISFQEQRDIGYAAAKACLDEEICLPQAILAPNSGFMESNAGVDLRPLRGRGIRELLHDSARP